jgi:hypothetical protein
LKPIKSLKKLTFEFSQSTSILRFGDRLAQVFPSLTDLSLKRGNQSIRNVHLNTLPSTLRRLELEASSSDSNEPVNLILLSKISQNLERLHLRNIDTVLGPGESLAQFQFSESVLDLCLTSVFVSQLISKLPRYAECVTIGFKSEVTTPEDISISVWPRTLRHFKLIYSPFNMQFALDECFPPHLETLYGPLTWEPLPANFQLPNTLQEIDWCPIELFGNDFETLPQAMTHLSVYQVELEERHIKNFPPSLSSLLLSADISDVVLEMLPKTITKLRLSHGWNHHLLSMKLTREVCKSLELLLDLKCSLHHFASADCLNAFRRMRNLSISVQDEYLADEENLFSHLSDSTTVSSLEDLRVQVLNSHCTVWRGRLSQVQGFRNLINLEWIVTIYEEENEDDEMHEMGETDEMGLVGCCKILRYPEYFKFLPPNLVSLNIPSPVLPTSHALAMSITLEERFLECFRRFPPNLISLTFGALPPDPYSLKTTPIWLSDECFAHLLKASLTFTQEMWLASVYFILFSRSNIVIYPKNRSQSTETSIHF